jgi:hypothetical protein
MKSTKLSTIMFSIIIVLAMMLSIQNNAFSENWRDGFARISMLPQGVYEHQCFTANGFVYCAGGYGDNGRIDKVWYAKINSDGYLGEWNETTSLPYAVYEHQCFTANGFVYCAGGDTGSRTSQIWYATLNVDGSLGNWQKTTSLPQSVFKHQCITANGFVYSLGGLATYNNETTLVTYATLKTDGSLGNWQETTSLPKSVCSHQCFTANGFVYCAGGYTGSETSQVWYATLNADGSLGNWQETTSLPDFVSEHQCFTANGLVYCVWSRYIIYAYLNADGSIGSWQKKEALPYSATRHQCITINGFFYCIGGSSKKDILMYFEPIITMPTHPNENNWYITNNCSFYLNDKIKIPHGFYYNIDNKQDTEVTATNSEYTTIRSINLTSGKAVEQGVHYLHLELADSQYMPQNSYHFKFKTYADPIDITSPTHSNQSEWFDNSSFQIDFNNKNTNLTYRYVIDDYSDTIPSSSSAILDSINRVFVNQQPGIHYLHVQVFDELGTTGQTLHFRYNIYDSNEPKPAPLPVVTKLNVDPTSVTKDGTISIEGTIEIK